MKTNFVKNCETQETGKASKMKLLKRLLWTVIYTFKKPHTKSEIVLQYCRKRGLEICDAVVAKVPTEKLLGFPFVKDGKVKWGYRK